MYIKRRNIGDLYNATCYYKDPNCTIRHREDGPAIEYSNGYKEWHINGKLHRKDGPAVECADGGKEWYLNGKLHRINGPAIIRANGNKAWYLNNNLHRENGPAIIDTNGDKFYYLNNQSLSKEEYIAYIKSRPLCQAKKSRILKCL